MRRRVAGACTALAGAVVLASCSEDGRARDAAEPRDGPAAVAGRCFVSMQSVLGRVPNDAGGAPVGPGWIRVDGGAGDDSGATVLVDADGASLAGSWRRAAPDSLYIDAFDDFLRVELRLSPVGPELRGTVRAVSDAVVERDPAGGRRGLDRTTNLDAREAPCDSMPRVRNT